MTIKLPVVSECGIDDRGQMTYLLVEGEINDRADMTRVLVLGCFDKYGYITYLVDNELISIGGLKEQQNKGVNCQLEKTDEEKLGLAKQNVIKAINSLKQTNLNTEGEVDTLYKLLQDSAIPMGYHVENLKDLSKKDDTYKIKNAKGYLKLAIAKLEQVKDVYVNHMVSHLTSNVRSMDCFLKDAERNKTIDLDYVAHELQIDREIYCARFNSKGDVDVRFKDGQVHIIPAKYYRPGEKSYNNLESPNINLFVYFSPKGTIVAQILNEEVLRFECTNKRIKNAAKYAKKADKAIYQGKYSLSKWELLVKLHIH